MNAPEIVVDARGLGKSYRLKTRGAHAVLGRIGTEFWALKDVDLQLRRGEAVGVVGENGAGKSTLLKLLCGTLRATTGSVRVEGRVAALLELGAGFNPNFTGRENVWLNAALLGLSKAEIAARFDAIAAFAGIGDFIDLPVRLYSSGMQARLGFAVGAHVDADVLIVDEVLSVGDAAFAQKCSARLERFRKSGTLLFVSHSTGAVARVCDRALWLERGEVKELGPAADVCAHYLASLAERAETNSSVGGKAANNAASVSHRALLPPPPLMRDPRNLRQNTVAVSQFNPDAPWHGHGGARVEDAFFCDPGGAHQTAISGGEEVELRVRCRADRDITCPVVGFLVRDHLGQNIFGDNTYLSCKDDPRSLQAGDVFEAGFRFQLPFMAAGDYTLTVAVTDGTQEDHLHLHWVEEAIVLEVTTTPVRRGIVGIPSAGISVERAIMSVR